MPPTTNTESCTSIRVSSSSQERARRSSSGGGAGTAIVLKVASLTRFGVLLLPRAFTTKSSSWLGQTSMWAPTLSTLAATTWQSFSDTSHETSLLLSRCTYHVAKHNGMTGPSAVRPDCVSARTVVKTPHAAALHASISLERRGSRTLLLRMRDTVRSAASISTVERRRT